MQNMQIEKGQIVRGLLDEDVVRIEEIKPMGNGFSVTFTNTTSNIQNNVVLTEAELARAEPVGLDGSFNFGGDPEAFKLYAEAERVSSAFQFDPLFAVNCSIVEPLPHQLEAVYRYLLPQPQIRFLLADDTGAGKTIMTGLLIKELLVRDLIKRILIVTPGGLTKQWQQDEMGLKFNIDCHLVDRPTLNADPNVFSNNDIIVTSIDFIRNEDVLQVLSGTDWDLIVVDEAHKLSAFDYGKKQYLSKRYTAVQSLAHQTEHLLLLTATPHRGRQDTFKYLLQLLDEDIFSSESMVSQRVQEVSSSGINKFFIRRLKEQMQDWQGRPLFMDRYTRTVQYELTQKEKRLYDNVTSYLMEKRERAQEQKNIHVHLAMMVIQRRLTSSIRAIRNTLHHRYDAIRNLIESLNETPDLLTKRGQLELEFSELDDYDDLDDAEREQLESIAQDPKQFKLFTTASNKQELKTEAEQLKHLVDLVDELEADQHEEQKLQRLISFLTSEGVFDQNEKLVIFTEHKDTLDYLEEKLGNNGYRVATIHGSKNVDQRRQAQDQFAGDAQVLIATDAAGEGINLQFCRLMVNWDIPWNPNRLEQRMGRIHRYGQQDDVVVFNLVAKNTLEGKVLQKLLEKLDQIREDIGDDRVYDVISDVFDGVNMDKIVQATFSGAENEYTEAIDHEFTPEAVRQKITKQKEELGSSSVDYSVNSFARKLRDESDERRLQPIYIRKFFESAFKHFGGSFHELRSGIYQIDQFPQELLQILQHQYRKSSAIQQALLCFDKAVFLEQHNAGDLSQLQYINPGNPLFDSLLQLVKKRCKEDMLKGTVLVDPNETKAQFGFFIKSSIINQQTGGTNIVDERLACVLTDETESPERFQLTSAAKFIDLYPPKAFAKAVEPPEPLSEDAVVQWSFETITEPQFEETKSRIEQDVANQRTYLEEGFTEAILILQGEISDLQAKLMRKQNIKEEERLKKLEARVETLKPKKQERLAALDRMSRVHPQAPEVLGCAYLMPLSQMEFEESFGMQRDDEVEAIAMQEAMAFERAAGRTPTDVAAENLGYDLRSLDENGLKRYIEVKGRAQSGDIMLSENEMNRLAQLGDSAWLYIVIHCRTEPKLYYFQDPAQHLHFEQKSKGVQYKLPENVWTQQAQTQ